VQNQEAGSEAHRNRAPADHSYDQPLVVLHRSYSRRPLHGCGVYMSGIPNAQEPTTPYPAGYVSLPNANEYITARIEDCSDSNTADLPYNPPPIDPIQ